MLATHNYGGAIRRPLFRLDPAFGAIWRELQDARPPARSSGGFVEDGDHYTLEIKVPGLAKGDLALTVEDGVVNVNGERKVVLPDGYEPVRRERRDFRVERRVAIPGDTLLDALEATVADGVLTVTVPRIAAPKPRSIEIV